MRYRVSVIIPTYNRSRVLLRAINSVINQTCKPFEVIVVDDGSTDDTKKALDIYGDKIKYLYRENSGRPGVARNTGLEHAKGDWIAFIDSDDVWRPDKLQLQLGLIEKAKVPLGLVFGDYEVVNHDNSLRRAKVFNPSDLGRLAEFDLEEGKIFKKDLFYYFLILKNPIHTSSVLLNRELFDSVHGFDPSLTIAEDRDLWIRSAERMQVGYVSEVTCKYTHQGGNITQDILFYSESVSCVMQRHFDRNKHDIPGWLNGAIKTSLRRQYRGLSFLNAKLKKRSDAVKYIAKSLKYPDLATLYYFCQILAVLISPDIYNSIQTRMEAKRPDSSHGQ